MAWHNRVFATRVNAISTQIFPWPCHLELVLIQPSNLLSYNPGHENITGQSTGFTYSLNNTMVCGLIQCSQVTLKCWMNIDNIVYRAKEICNIYVPHTSHITDGLDNKDIWLCGIFLNIFKIEPGECQIWNSSSL